MIGATGNIGFATLASLSSKYADKVQIRAGVRNPDHEKTERIRYFPGVQVVQATMGDARLSETLQNIDILYIVTPNAENRVELVLSTAEQAKKAGVKHIAVVTIPPSDYTIFGRQCLEIEGKISKLGVPYTFIRLQILTESFLAFRDSIVGQGTIYSPIDPEKPFLILAAEDAGKAAAEILTNPTKYTNKSVYVVSDRHTYNDVVKIFGIVLKKEIKFVRVSYEAAEQAMIGQGHPKWHVDGLLEVFKLIDAGDPIMEKADLGLYKKITGEDPTDLKTWVTKNAESFQ